MARHYQLCLGIAFAVQIVFIYQSIMHMLRLLLNDLWPVWASCTINDGLIIMNL